MKQARTFPKKNIEEKGIDRRWLIDSAKAVCLIL